MAGCGAAALALICAWLWTGTARIPERRLRDVGLSLRLPIYLSRPRAVGSWAVFVSMTGISTAYASLVFGYMFYWTIHPAWPPENAVSLRADGAVWPLVATGSVLAAWALCAAVPGRLMLLGRVTPALALAGAALLAAGYCAALWLWLVEAAALDPTSHVYPAAVMILHLWSAVFVAIGAIMAAFSAASVLAGRTDADHDADQVNTRLYWHFSIGFAVVSLIVTSGFPMLSGG